MPRARALMDVLPWDLFVAPGVLLHADGALSATVRYRGPDPDSSTEDELVGLGRTCLQAFRNLGDGWLLHFDLHRVPASDYPEAGAFPDPYTRALDAERREAYRRSRSHYVSEHYLTLTYQPPARERRSRLDALLHPDLEARSLSGRIEQFGDALEEILATLSTVLRLDRLGTAAMLEYLHTCLTFLRQPLSLPEDVPFTLEHLFASGDLYGGQVLRFGETTILPIRFSGFPDSVHPASLDFLNDLPLPFRVTFRWIAMDPHAARAAIKRRRGQWNTAGVGLRQALAVLFSGPGAQPAFTERFAPTMAADADDALLEIESAQLPAGYLTTTFFVASTDPAEAKERARLLVKHLRSAGFTAAVEDLNALDAYLGALPGDGRGNIRRPLFTLPAALNLVPITSVWAGEPHHPHPALAQYPPTILAATSGSTPFAFSPAVADVQHTAVIGPTGAGKSVFVNLLLAQYFRYPHAQVISLDKGYSQLALAAAAGGHHYDLSADAETEALHRFAPLEHLDTADDFQRATEWVLALVETAGLTLTPALKRTVTQALRDLRETSVRTLATFAIKAQSHELRQALEPYTLEGPYASLFDGRASSVRDADFLVFEMERLLPLREAVVTPAVLHLFDEVERRLSGRPTLLVVEELAGYLHRPRFAQRFRSYLLELRKRNAGLVFVAQNVSALLESPLRAAVLENTPTKVYLPNPSANEPAVAEAYRAVGLNDRQIDILAAATPRRDYYVHTPHGSRLFQLGLSPAALAVLGLAGPTARQTVHDARTTWGADWVGPYLAELGHERFAHLLAPDAAA